MIIEHEIIEQIQDEPFGRPLDWCARFASELGARDPLATLRQRCRAGYLRLEDASGPPLPPWRLEEIWREGAARGDIAVFATDLGCRWVHG